MSSPAQLVQHLFSDASSLFQHPGIVWSIITLASGVIARWVRKGRQLAKRRVVERSVRGWLTVSAVIDVVSVSGHLDSDGKKFYLAALTYFYRRPDLQIGEYKREFPLKAAAQQWVKQFKGSQVMVHVNPNDPADSFLLDSDLEGLDGHQAPNIAAPARFDSPAILPHNSRFLCAIGEQLSIAGLAGSVALLAVSIVTGGRKCPHWLLWTGGAMLVIALLIMIVVQFQSRGNESARHLLHNYKLYAPAWMRWSLKLSVVAYFLLYFLHLLSADLPLTVQLWMKGIEPCLPYFLGCFGFLATASFHTAVLRSQEQIQLPVSSA